MSDNVTANRLTSICTGEQSARTRIRLDLVGHEDSDVEFFCHVLEPIEMQAELLLALIQFSTTEVVNTEESADAVNDKQAVLASCEILVELGEKVMLVFAILRTSDSDVLNSRIAVDSKSFSNLQNALWTESAFSI